MKVKNMLKTNDIQKKSAKSYKTGVIFVIWYFTVLPCSFLHLPVELQYLNNRNTHKHDILHVLLHLPVELQYLNKRNTHKHEILHVYIHIFFVACAQCCYIFINPFTCVTDRYQHKQCSIMAAETETNMKICMYTDFIMGMCNVLYFR